MLKVFVKHDKVGIRADYEMRQFAGQLGLTELAQCGAMLIEGEDASDTACTICSNIHKLHSLANKARHGNRHNRRTLRSERIRLEQAFTHLSR